MEHNEAELKYERERLDKTIALAKRQLNQAKQNNEENKAAIITAKQELRENTVHSISNLGSSDDFEALIELNQYVDPVTTKLADYEATEDKIKALETLIQSPYFARIDFRFDDEEEAEQIYIGRTSLKEEASYEMYVYDWRSPIASVFYRFTAGAAWYDAPGGRIHGEVALKRQYEIRESELAYFFDADVQIVDEFLRKLLTQNTSPKMKTIVETIQKEQDIVIRDMESGLMMVQGVAGSGKTSIALHRAAYLMYQGLSARLSASNILIISPNTLFEQYISNVLPELGEENVVSVVFEDMMAKILKNKRIQSRNQFLERLISSHRYRVIMKSSMEFKTSYQFIAMLDRFVKELPHKWIEFQDVYYDGEFIIGKDTLRAQLLSRKKDTPIGVKLKQLEKYIMERVYEVRGKRVRHSEIMNVKQEVRKFTVLQVEALYRHLCADTEYFYSLAEGTKLPENIEDILSYTNENLEQPYLHYDDAAVLTYLQLQVNGSGAYKEIKQVIIDEAQDYYPLHYEIFHQLFAAAKFTVLGDINQTLEKEEDLSLYEQIQDIFGKKKSTLVTMDKSFRCTSNILKFSAKFLDQKYEIRSYSREGDEPCIYLSENWEQHNDAIVAEVERCLEQGFGSVGLICKSERNARMLYENIKDRTGVGYIKNGSNEDLQGVFVIPVYMSKGLEFDAVLICDADARNYHSIDDKKLLYIASTRALHRLNLFCKGERSPLI